MYTMSKVSVRCGLGFASDGAAALLVTLCALLPWQVQAQPRPDRPMASQPADIAVAIDAHRVDTFVLPSPWRATGFRIQVWRPLGPPPAGGYPVLYLLDGNAAFDSLRQARAELGRARGAPVILVGVGYDVDDRYDVQARSMDYTPPSSGADKPLGVPGNPTAPGRAQPGGGADRMLAWMDGTLRPLIAQRYPVAADRQGIYGHSFGALLVLHALFTDPARYQTYVAASPSTWWNDRAIVKEARNVAVGAQATGRPARLFVLAGGKELDGVMAEDSPEAIARMVNAAGGAGAGVRASYAHQPGKTHGEMLPIGLAHAVRWMAAEHSAPGSAE